MKQLINTFKFESLLIIILMTVVSFNLINDRSSSATFRKSAATNNNISITENKVQLDSLSQTKVQEAEIKKID